jgi:pimeloyl-ACP methyl ester carboxylesterase
MNTNPSVLLSKTALALFTVLLIVLNTAAATKQVIKDQFASFDGVKVHYQSQGKGREALVFVHGWTCNLNFWKENFPAFTDQTRVILLDLPGHGQSDKPQTIYSMDLFARAIDAVLQKEKIERATLVGHSMGTPVIRQFYRLYPQKTRALVIVDGALRTYGTKESMKQYLEPYRGTGYKQHAEQSITFLTQGMKNAEKTAWVRTQMLQTPQHVMLSAFEGMLDPVIWEKQEKINVPVLTLMAVNPMWNAEYEKFVRNLIPDLDYQVWDGVSHFLMMDEPQKFNEAVAAFLHKNNLLKK